MREVSGIAQVKTHGITKEYLEGTMWMEIVRRHQKKYEYDILPVRVNGKLRELHRQVGDCRLSSVTTKDKPGISTCQRSASLMMSKAFCGVAGPGSVEKLTTSFSIGREFFVKARGNLVLDQESLDAVKVKMREYVERKIFITRHSVSTNDAIELFEKLGMYNKARLLRYRMVSRVNTYSIDGFKDYYYGCIVQNTGYIKHFDLVPYHCGFVMATSDRNMLDIPYKFTPSDKLFATLSEFVEWGRRMDLETIGALSGKIAEGNMSHLTLIQGTLQEKKIAKIVAQVTARKNVRFVMIAGPSSPGRTTFSHRLSVQPEAIGLKPYPTAMDNYLVNRVDSPRDEHGNYNYEVLEYLDAELFNRDMADLLGGKRVELPRYNFRKGTKEYKENFFQLGEGDIPVMEGIHCSNDRLSHTPPTDNKFRIYISTLTQLNIDEHSHVPTTDRRLLGRMVRDTRTRGPSTRETIRMQPSVRRDEEENIFPFQGGVDAMFSSALVYELAVLKQYAQSLLSTIPRDSEEWLEAKRLLELLDYFIDVSNKDIPRSPILREFIGGSCLNA